MRKQKIKALKQARARERAQGIHSNSELDSALAKITSKPSSDASKPRKREAKAQAKSTPREAQPQNKILSQRELARQAEILKRKTLMVTILKLFGR